MEAADMQSANAARSIKTPPIQQSVARDSKGESYDQIRKLGELVEKAAIPDDLRKILNDRIARLGLSVPVRVL